MKEELRKILEMSKSGAITEEQAALLLEELSRALQQRSQYEQDHGDPIGRLPMEPFQSDGEPRGWRSTRPRRAHRFEGWASKLGEISLKDSEAFLAAISAKG